MELTVQDIQTWLDNYSKVIEEKRLSKRIRHADW